MNDNNISSASAFDDGGAPLPANLTILGSGGSGPTPPVIPRSYFFTYLDYSPYQNTTGGGAYGPIASLRFTLWPVVTSNNFVNNAGLSLTYSGTETARFKVSLLVGITQGLLSAPRKLSGRFYFTVNGPAVPPPPSEVSAWSEAPYGSTQTTVSQFLLPRAVVLNPGDILRFWIQDMSGVIGTYVVQGTGAVYPAVSSITISEI